MTPEISSGPAVTAKPPSTQTGWLRWMHPVPLSLIVAVLCLGAVALALVSQYRFGMQPCPWCTLQRLLFLGVAASALVCAWRPTGWTALISSGLGLLLVASGVASALWQHFVASKSASCALTLADRIMDALGLMRLLPSVFEPKGSCADAAVRLLGLPYEIWSLSLYLVCGGLLLAVLCEVVRQRSSD